VDELLLEDELAPPPAPPPPPALDVLLAEDALDAPREDVVLLVTEAPPLPLKTKDG
jgi:hypothetical protein